LLRDLFSGTKPTAEQLRAGAEQKHTQKQLGLAFREAVTAAYEAERTVHDLGARLARIPEGDPLGLSMTKAFHAACHRINEVRGATCQPKESGRAMNAATVQPQMSDTNLHYFPDFQEISATGEWSDDALARCFTERHCDTYRYTAQLSRWRRWDGQRWVADTTLGVFDAARQVCRDVASLSSDKRVLKIASAQTVAAVERLARADRAHAATTDQWDADPWSLNTPEGIIDLVTGRLRTAAPDDYATKMTSVGPGGDCPLWMAFLKRVTCGDIQLQYFLQRFAGYCLTGSTREQSLAFLWGAGANGKSTFLATLSGIMADYSTVAPMDLFLETRFQSHPTELAGLNGARLVTACETAEGARWNEARVKILTGGDRVTARFMRGDYFSFLPQFKLAIAANHRPALRSVDEAMRRRIHLVPFTAAIPSDERDPQLPEKLRLEWPGILAWAIEGCLRWIQFGLQAPEAVQVASSEYVEAEDCLQQWIDDRCEIHKDAWSASAILFADWQRYAEAAGESAGTQKRFAQRLVGHGMKAQRTTAARGFLDIRLKGTP
jgi:putative DNA primase/helicase